MEKLKIAIQEIQIVNELLKETRGGFLKRILARAIALRVHNLLVDQIFYRTNNLVNSSNSSLKKSIRKDLNALKELYVKFFETQRHKFSGHFQDLPLGERIDLWTKIDLTTANFFYELPIEIYNKFSSVPSY
jgi:hypothetical protein